MIGFFFSASLWCPAFWCPAFWCSALWCVAAPVALEIPNLEVKLEANPVLSRPRIEAYSYSEKNESKPQPKIDRSVAGPWTHQGKGPRFHVVGIHLRNTGSEPLEIRFRSRQFPKKKKYAVTVPPHEVVKRFFAVKEPKSRKVELLVMKKGDKDEVPFPIELPEGKGWRLAEVPLGIAMELEREDEERRIVKARSVEITVHDDLELAVEKTHLLLLLVDGMMVYEGDTDATGRWTGKVMPGAYEVYAFAEVPDRTDYDAQTAVRQLPRLLVLRGTLAAGASTLALKPERMVETRVFETDERPLVPNHIWITPNELVDAYRYEIVSQRLGSRVRLESKRENPGGRFLVLTSNGLAAKVGMVCEIDGTTLVLLHADLDGKKNTLELPFRPERLGRVLIDPATGAGPGEKAWVHLLALDGVRETAEFTTEGLFTAYLPPGSYRTEISYRLAGGQEVDFIPYRLEIAAGAIEDLTPRGPFDLPLYWKRDGKKVSFWLSVVDAKGRVLRDPPQKGGSIRGAWRGTAFIDRELDAFHFEYAEGFERVDLAKIEYTAKVPFGEEPIELAPHLERTTVYNEASQSADAPACFGDRVRQLLPEIQSSIQGAWDLLGVPDGVRQLHLEFVIFLSPGIGGQADGSRVTMDTRVLHHFTGATDRLPAPYPHEYSHVLTFGHDPYGMLGPEALYETRLGEFGYRMLHADDFQTTLRYLEGDRKDDTPTWDPSPGVFAGIRLLFGPEIHKRVITERKRSEQTMALHGLSTIERMAALYSVVLDRNIAWIFRAHGWPVSDLRVEVGRNSLRLKKHPKPLTFAQIDGTSFDSWWIYGPVLEPEEKSKWRHVSWPSRIVRLDEDVEPAQEKQLYRLYRRFVSPVDGEARLVVAADVGLDIVLNGNPLTRIDPSPPFAQPLHDEVTFQQKRGYHVWIHRGVNIIEIGASQPPGTRGFQLEIFDLNGKPFRLAQDYDGPPVDELPRNRTRLEYRDPVENGSFENGKEFPDVWLEGPNEPRGGIEVSLDGSTSVDGEVSLKLEMKTASRGAVIQRLVVDPGKRYRFTASIRTEGLEGETFVSLFNNDIHTQFGKTEPLRTANTEWTEYEAVYMSGITRVIYMACYVKGKKGTVWFDNIRMVEIGRR